MPVINAYCRNLGWLFEDLKALFEESGAVVSEKPLKGADAWICLRTHELDESPDLSRTVIQVHDLFEHRFPAGVTDSIVVRSHPDQVAAGAQSPVIPLGARRMFRCRDSMPAEPAVGWFGRPVRWRGDEIRSPDPLIMALVAAKQQGRSIRLVLVGQNLRLAAEMARAAGIDTTLYERPPLTIRSYPMIYHLVDAVVITSRQEAGPMPLFESLACGVPVFSTAVGWSPTLLKGFNGRLYKLDEPEDLLSALRGIHDGRREFFLRREAIRASLGERWLDGPGGWIEQNMKLATELTEVAT